MTAKNPWIGVNYIDDNSRMAVPPAFFLQRIYDYDAELVMFPSRHVPYAYVLARRRRFRIVSLDQALEKTIEQPDTKLCLQRGLVPVTMIIRHSMKSWDVDAVIRSLQARDIWAHGGGDAYTNKIEDHESAEEQSKRKQLRDDMWMRSGQAWESYKRRTGQRVSSSGVATQRAPLPTKPSGSTGGSGIVLADR
jgi:hypothetical protein